MVSIPSLWLPILLSAILVFIVSSIIHMLLPYHRNDFGKVPSEDEVMDALRKFDIPPGEYVIPNAANPEEMRSEAYQAKTQKGPVAFATFLPPGPIAMGSSLIQWFVYCIVVGIFVAYLTGRTLGAGAEYMNVFRYAGTTAFLAYAAALSQNSIWFKRKWSSTAKHTFDGLVYSLVTAGAFGWLWPS